MATLTPIPGQAAQSAAAPFLCLACGETGGADFLSNIVLFLPLGLALAGLEVPGLLATALGMTLSGFVEGMQFVAIAGRDASLSDIVANTAGTAIGWMLMANRGLLLAPAPGAARRLFVAWAALVLATAGFTHWALAPDLPQAPWFGQWTTGEAEPEFFSGQVLAVRLGRLPVTHWQVEESLRLRLAERSVDTVALEADVVAGAPEPEARRILSLAGDRFRFLSLGTGGGDLSFAVRTRAARLRLIAPRFRLPDGMKATPGSVVRIEASYARGVATLRSRGATDRQAVTRIGVMDPWLFLWPWAVPSGWILNLLRLGTLAVYLGPLWVWGRRAVQK